MPLESTISRTVSGLYELRLQGSIFQPHWMTNLFAALSQRQISIISGDATQGADGEWKSRFNLDFSKSVAKPDQLNYSAFAEQPPAIERKEPARLNRFTLKRRVDQLIEVSLEGPDQIGFLASVLVPVSGLALFPSSLKIDTVATKIHDSIVLRSISAKGPSDAVYQALERMLNSFLIK